MGEQAEKAKANKDLVTYIKKNFYIPETKDHPIHQGRIALVQYQEDLLREALTPDENGNFKYSIIVWSDIKKSGKSTIAAAVNYARAKHTEWGEFYIVANDLKQADSRVARYLKRAVRLNKSDHDIKTPGYRINFPSGSFAEAIPIDPEGEAGSNADMVTFSELWGANEEAQKNMWAEMTLSPTKLGKSFRWVESYAGFSGQSILLYSLFEQGTKAEFGAELLWPDRLYPVTGGPPTVLEAYVNKSIGMLCLWNTQPRCPWQIKEYYDAEQGTLLPNQFSRMHRNQWVSPTETFVPMEWLDACNRTDEWPKFVVEDKSSNSTVFSQKKWPMVIAMDAAVSDDTFAVWMGCRHPEFHSEVLTWYCRVWKPQPGKKINYQGTDEEPGPEKEIRRLIKEYNVVQVTYDPTQLHDMATRLYGEGLAWFSQFDQGEDRLLADGDLRGSIRDRTFWHRGEKDMRDHALNADAKIDSEDRKVRIVKRTATLKIDAIVAASMGRYRVLHLNLI